MASPSSVSSSSTKPPPSAWHTPQQIAKAKRLAWSLLTPSLRSQLGRNAEGERLLSNHNNTGGSSDGGRPNNQNPHQQGGGGNWLRLAVAARDAANATGTPAAHVVMDDTARGPPPTYAEKQKILKTMLGTSRMLRESFVGQQDDGEKHNVGERAASQERGGGSTSSGKGPFVAVAAASTTATGNRSSEGPPGAAAAPSETELAAAEEAQWYLTCSDEDWEIQERARPPKPGEHHQRIYQMKCRFGKFLADCGGSASAATAATTKGGSGNTAARVTATAVLRDVSNPSSLQSLNHESDDRGGEFLANSTSSSMLEPPLGGSALGAHHNPFHGSPTRRSVGGRSSGGGGGAVVVRDVASDDPTISAAAGGNAEGPLRKSSISSFRRVATTVSTAALAAAPKWNDGPGDGNRNDVDRAVLMSFFPRKRGESAEQYDNRVTAAMQASSVRSLPLVVDAKAICTNRRSEQQQQQHASAGGGEGGDKSGGNIIEAANKQDHHARQRFPSRNSRSHSEEGDDDDGNDVHHILRSMAFHSAPVAAAVGAKDTGSQIRSSDSTMRREEKSLLSQAAPQPQQGDAASSTLLLLQQEQQQEQQERQAEHEQTQKILSNHAPFVAVHCTASAAQASSSHPQRHLLSQDHGTSTSGDSSSGAMLLLKRLPGGYVTAVAPPPPPPPANTTVLSAMSAMMSSAGGDEESSPSAVATKRRLSMRRLSMINKFRRSDSTKGGTDVSPPRGGDAQQQPQQDGASGAGAAVDTSSVGSDLSAVFGGGGLDGEQQLQSSSLVLSVDSPPSPILPKKKATGNLSSVVARLSLADATDRNESRGSTSAAVSLASKKQPVPTPLAPSRKQLQVMEDCGMQSLVLQSSSSTPHNHKKRHLRPRDAEPNHQRRHLSSPTRRTTGGLVEEAPQHVRHVATAASSSVTADPTPSTTTTALVCNPRQMARFRPQNRPVSADLSELYDAADSSIPALTDQEERAHGGTTSQQQDEGGNHGSEHHHHGGVPSRAVSAQSVRSTAGPSPSRKGCRQCRIRPKRPHSSSSMSSAVLESPAQVPLIPPPPPVSLLDLHGNVVHVDQQSYKGPTEYSRRTCVYDVSPASLTQDWVVVAQPPSLREARYSPPRSVTPVKRTGSAATTSPLRRPASSSSSTAAAHSSQPPYPAAQEGRVVRMIGPRCMSAAEVRTKTQFYNSTYQPEPSRATQSVVLAGDVTVDAMLQRQREFLALDPSRRLASALPLAVVPAAAAKPFTRGATISAVRDPSTSQQSSSGTPSILMLLPMRRGNSASSVSRGAPQQQHHFPASLSLQSRQLTSLREYRPGSSGPTTSATSATATRRSGKRPSSCS